ncbi:hypothetical protein GCM10010446_24550 [Streptomyces enissocaesilis]|uniref:Integral membrane protein n=2 Tax=Streptomyces enissocaesilis TaxID=332589 RepID=A0ABN3X5P0_9ACTN
MIRPVDRADRGTRLGMAPKTDHLMSVRAARQLRRARTFYVAGALLWAAAAAWTGWTHPGSRQMWVSVLLLAVFTGLLCTASLWLRRLQAATRNRLAHHAAPRRLVASRQA